MGEVGMWWRGCLVERCCGASRSGVDVKRLLFDRVLIWFVMEWMNVGDDVVQRFAIALGEMSKRITGGMRL